MKTQSTSSTFEDIQKIITNEEEAHQFFKIIQKTSKGKRIMNGPQRKFLTDMVDRMIQKDEAPLFHLFYKNGIIPFDAYGRDDTYLRWFLSSEKTINCLVEYLSLEKGLNVNSDFQEPDAEVEFTVLQQAALLGQPKVIQALLQHAKDHHVVCEKKNVVACAVKTHRAAALRLLLAEGFSPYTKDNELTSIRQWVHDAQKGDIPIYSLLFTVLANPYGTSEKDIAQMHTLLLQHMDSVDQLTEERNRLTQILRKGWARFNNRDTELLKQIDEKLKTLTEKKLLEKEIHFQPLSQQKSPQSLKNKI